VDAPAEKEEPRDATETSTKPSSKGESTNFHYSSLKPGQRVPKGLASLERQIQFAKQHGSELVITLRP